MLVVLLFVLTGCSEEGTEPEDMRATVENCWPCTMYKVIFETINQLVLQLYNDLVPKAMGLLGIGVLFWLAFRTGKMVVSLYEPDLNEYVQSVKTILFKAILVSAVLLVGDNFICFISMVLEPPMLTISYFSSALLQTSIDSLAVTLPQEFINIPAAQCQVFTEEVALYLQRMVYQIYASLNAGISFGWSLVRTTNFVCMIMGLFVVIPTFFLLSLIFPLMFADSFVRLGASIVLSPFLFVAWVFPATKNMLKSLWDVAFGSMITMMIGCIYITLAINVMQVFQESSESLKGIFSEARQLADPNLSLAVRRMSTEAVSFMVLIFIILKFHKSVTEVAGYLGGDSTKSSVVAVLGGIKQLAISAAMIAVGAVMAYCGIPGGTKLMKAGAQRIKDQMAEGAKNIASDSGGSGDATGGGGVISAVKGAYSGGDDKDSGKGDDKSGDDKGSSKGDAGTADKGGGSGENKGSEDKK
ncbi:MAG: hypothetical protein IKV03_04360 [Alphaproteobacteria bacterium]|nr:hypothetical protein [Alphaproteobacteria bacterium]